MHKLPGPCHGVTVSTPQTGKRDTERSHHVPKVKVTQLMNSRAGTGTRISWLRVCPLQSTRHPVLALFCTLHAVSWHHAGSFNIRTKKYKSKSQDVKGVQ